MDHLVGEGSRGLLAEGVANGTAVGGRAESVETRFEPGERCASHEDQSSKDPAAGGRVFAALLVDLNHPRTGGVESFHFL